jgi:hypothetical protein
MLTGRPAFSASNAAQLLSQKRAGAAPLLLDRDRVAFPHVLDGLEALILGCLDPDPTRRPAIAVLLESLHHVYEQLLQRAPSEGHSAPGEPDTDRHARLEIEGLATVDSEVAEVAAIAIREAETMIAGGFGSLALRATLPVVRARLEGIRELEELRGLLRRVSGGVNRRIINRYERLRWTEAEVLFLHERPSLQEGDDPSCIDWALSEVEDLFDDHDRYCEDWERAKKVADEFLAVPLAVENDDIRPLVLRLVEAAIADADRLPPDAPREVVEAAKALRHLGSKLEGIKDSHRR